MSALLQGQVVVVTARITSDAAGLVPVDDGTATITAYKPDGTNTALNPVHGATGLYSAQVTLDQPSWWEFVSTSTTTGAGKGRTSVYVSPVP